MLWATPVFMPPCEKGLILICKLKLNLSGSGFYIGCLIRERIPCDGFPPIPFSFLIDQLEVFGRGRRKTWTIYTVVVIRLWGTCMQLNRNPTVDCVEPTVKQVSSLMTPWGVYHKSCYCFTDTAKWEERWEESGNCSIMMFWMLGTGLDFSSPLPKLR